MPAPHSRTHPKIRVEDLAPDAPGHFLSLKEHKYVRTIQLRHSFVHHKSLTNMFLSPKDHQTLSHPVFIGEKGETISIYQKQPLGKGAFGTVYLGINLDTGEIHAIKYQTPKKKTDVAQVVVEDKILDDLGTLIDRTVTTALGERTVISAQKLAWGENMRSYVLRKKEGPHSSSSSSQGVTPLSDMESVDMAIQLLEQIDSAHQKGYVHRDIKLENAMWDEETKTATLIDFGISKKMKNGKYIGKDIEGTPHIIAPEIYAANSEAVMNDRSPKLAYSPATDMYAAGIALVELTSDQNPNLGIDAKGFFLHAVAMTEAADSPGIPEKLLASAPDVLIDESPDPLKNEFNHCIRKMLQANPNERITFGDALAELRSIKERMENREIVSAEVATTSNELDTSIKEDETFNIQDQDVLAALDALQSFAPDSDSPAAIELSQNELEAQLNELAAFMDAKPSPYILEADSVPSSAVRAPVKDLTEIADPDYKALYETLNDFIDSNKEDVSPSHSSRKSFLLSEVSVSDKEEFINDLNQMQNLIIQCDQTPDVNQNSLLLLELSDLITAMRGKNYAANLRDAKDMQKSSQFGFSKSLDQLLQYTGMTVQQKLESTPAYENGNKLRAKERRDHRHRSPSPGEAARKKKSRAGGRSHS